MSALHIPLADTADLPSVRSAAEYGRLGYLAMRAKYGDRQLNEWRRKGGRRPDPCITTLATTGPKARKTTRRDAIER